MHPMSFMAGVLTVVLAVVFIAALVLGITFANIRLLSFLAPFFLCVPTLAALGAAAGSWGASIWGHNHYPRQGGAVAQGSPFWCWLIGFGVGAFVGAVLGLGLELLVRRMFRNTIPTAQRPLGPSPVVTSDVDTPARLS